MKAYQEEWLDRLLESEDAAADVCREIAEDDTGDTDSLAAKLADMLSRTIVERDEARDWVRRMMKDRTTTCVYCGHQYPPGTPESGSDQQALTDHIRECPKHPLHQAQQLIYVLVNYIKWGDGYCTKGHAFAALSSFIKRNYPDGCMAIKSDDQLQLLYADGSAAVGNLHGLSRVKFPIDDVEDCDERKTE